jgi:hypothetical protein
MKLLKNYIHFIKESISKEDFDTVGEYIEKLAEDDEDARIFIGEYLKDYNPTVRIANSINLLSKSEQEEIINKILQNKKNVEPEEVTVIANTDLEVLESESSLGGKNLFKCFLKIITALGQKQINFNTELKPDDFFIYYLTDWINPEDLKSVMSRYDFFEELLLTMNIQSNVRLYYGIRDNLFFEYGLSVDGQNNPSGEFKLNKSSFDFIKTLSSPSSSNLKFFLNDIDFQKIKLMDKIKVEMANFNPGYCEKKSFEIQNEILTFGFYGIGKWDNGKMDLAEIENIKNNFRTFLMKYKWSDYIKISFKTEQFWLYLKIKIK